MHTLSLPLGTTTIPAHHSVGVSIFWMTLNCSIQQSSHSTRDFSGSGILWGFERAYGIASCFNTMLYSPSIVPRPLKILGNLETTLCLTESTVLIREINCSAVIAGRPMRTFRRSLTM